MNAADLITDVGTGRTSHTKLWANVAYAVSTFAVVWMTFKGTLTGEILLIYLGVVGAATTASKFLSMRYKTNVSGG